MGQHVVAVRKCVADKCLVDYSDSRQFPDRDAVVHYESWQLSAGKGKYRPEQSVKAWGKKMRERAIVNDALVYEILSVVEEIPEGKVATYGQIARLIGRDRNARLVGRILAMAEHYGEYPCHRVVNHAGRMAPRFAEQRSLLAAEGVVFRENGCVNMTKCQWQEAAEHGCES